jgi:competence protein ComEC
VDPALAFRLAAALEAWITAERGRFVLFLPVCMAGGVLLYFALPAEPPLWLTASLTVAAIGGVCATWRSAVARGVLLGAAFALLGCASAGLATWRAAPWDAVPQTAVRAVGVVENVDALPAGRRVTLGQVSLDGGAPLGRQVRVRLRTSDAVPAAPGDTLRVRALLLAPSPPAYPGGWDMQRDAFFAGMGAYGFAIGPAERLAQAPRPAWQAVRETIAARIMEGLPGERGAIAATLLTGLGSAIPPQDRLAFQASGLAHLLAVAGLHIGIVMGLVFVLLRHGLAASEYTALHWPTRRIAALASLAAGAAYLALTGAHIPILRSFAMASLVTLAVLTGRRAISLRALALAALVLMLAAPEEVMGVSFQMSFSAVLALVAGWEALRPLIAGFALGRWWRAPALYVGGLAATSALAGSASLPFAAYHFGNATLWYVPANMVAVPVTALWIMPWGLLALALMPVGLAAVALAPMGWGLSVVLWLARAVAAWPGALWPLPQIPPPALLLVAGGLVWLCLWRTRLRLAGLAPLVAGLIVPFAQPAPDAFVAADGRVIAARVGGGILSETRPGASAFEKDAPGRLWGVTASAFPDVSDGPALRCDAGGCRWWSAGLRFALLRGPDAPCGDADVVLAGGAVRDCAARVVIDRGFVVGNGATILRGGLVITDRERRGARPWVIGRAALLPAAVTE